MKKVENIENKKLEDLNTHAQKEAGIKTVLPTVLLVTSCCKAGVQATGSRTVYFTVEHFSDGGYNDEVVDEGGCDIDSSTYACKDCGESVDIGDLVREDAVEEDE